jgi:hypothetical protein
MNIYFVHWVWQISKMLLIGFICFFIIGKLLEYIELKQYHKDELRWRDYKNGINARSK